MPGKVNPVLCESVNQVAARVMGNDVTVGYAASQGILELNTYLPVIADALLESATLLGNVATVFAERCVAGIAVDEAARPRLRRAHLGAGDGAQPADRLRAGSGDRAQAQESGRSIIDVVVAEGRAHRPTRRAASSTRCGPPASRPRLDRRRSRSAAGEEVGEQVVAAPREDALGVELHALDGEVAMAHAHHRAVVGGRRDVELGRDRLGRQRQRVVTGRVSGDGKPANTPLPSWLISDVLPCINVAAPTTVAP